MSNAPDSLPGQNPDSASGPLFAVLDGNLQVRSCNAAFAACMGVDAATLRDTGLRKTLSRHFARKLHHAMTQTRAGHALKTVSLRVKNGASVKFDLTQVKLTQADNPEFLISAHLAGYAPMDGAVEGTPLDDTTDLRADILSAATTASSIGLWYVDTESKIANGNAAWYRSLGIAPRAEGVSLDEIRDRLHPEDQEKGDAGFGELLAGERESYQREYRMQAEDGSFVWMMSKGRRMPASQSGRPDLLVGTSIDITSRKSQEAAVIASAAEAEVALSQLKGLADQAPAAIYEMVMHADGTVSYPFRSARWAELIGASGAVTDERDDEPFKLVIEEDRPRVLRALERSRENQSYFAERFRIEHSVRGRRWINCEASPTALDDGAVKWYGVLYDITSDVGREQVLDRALRDTEHARAEAAEALERIQLIADKAPFATYEIRRTDDGKASFPWIGGRFLELRGLTEQELLESPEGILANIHPDDVGAYEAAIEHSAQTGSKLDVIYRISHPEKGMRWMRTQSHPADGGDGSITWYGGLLDVTDDVLREQALEAARAEAAHNDQFLEAAAEGADLGLWSVELETGKTWADKKLASMLGYSVKQASQKNFISEQIHPEDRPQRDQAWMDCAEGRSESYRIDFRVKHKDGHWKWIASSGKVLSREAQGLSNIMAGIFIDISQRKAQEQGLILAAEEAELARAEAAYANEILNSAAEGTNLGLWTHCPATNEVWFNKFFADMYGYDLETMPNDASIVLSHIHRDDIDRRNQAHKDYVDGKAERYSADFRICRPDGSVIWVQSGGYRVSRQEQGKPEVFAGTLLDITERKNQEARLAELAGRAERTHQHLSRIADNAPVGIFEFKREVDGHESFTFLSAKFVELVMRNVPPSGESKEDPLSHVHAEDLPILRQKIDQSAIDLQPVDSRHRVRNQAGEWIWVQSNAQPVANPDGSIIWFGSVSDISEQVAREEELLRARKEAERMRARVEHQALRDPLTGLFNRRAFDREMTERMARGEEVTIVRLDLDRFKFINDTLGHAAGDMVLVKVAEVLERERGDGCLVSRVGGDEFSIIMRPDSTLDESLEFVRRIKLRLAEPLYFEGRQCRFGASFGIASSHTTQADGGDLLSFADAALYEAKQAGRNRVEVFTSELHDDILHGRRLAGEIMESIEAELFEPFFQPQFDCYTGNLAGLEVLTRWRHPDRGLLPPASFLTVAEQIRAVPDIDRMMFNKTLDWLERWHAQGLLIPKVSFNVSSGRLNDPLLLSELSSANYYGTKISIELLESILIEDESEAFQFQIDTIQDAGIGIEIDDFGSGHASIVGLTAIGPDMLKIDRRLVAPITESDRAKQLVSAIVEIGRALDISITAEGVETAEHAELLKKLGCDVLQGYFFARPMSGRAFARFARGVKAA